MKALLVIDMQIGMFESASHPENIDAVVQRINNVARAIRAVGGLIVFIQHHDPPGTTFAEGETGWHFLPSLEQSATDAVVSKTTCDAFYNTNLDSVLKQHNVDELFISGWATDFCVDTTLRAAASRKYTITAVSDAHTAANRPHLSAASIIEHHNLTWCGMIVPGRQIEALNADAVIQQLTQKHQVGMK